MDKLLIVDGNSIANRAFYALPFLSNHLGQPSGAVYGFANILIKIIRQERPTHIVIAFDHTRKTFRNEIYSDYKMQRKPSPQELLSQFPLIKEMLDTMEIKVIEQAGIEADDIIGTISKNNNCYKLILSGDRDLLQLIDDKTVVWLTKKGVSEVDKVDEKQLMEEYKIKPYQVIELKALMGDTSDNIPGVKGVGEKTALNLIEEYKNIDNVYKNLNNLKPKLKEKLEENKDIAYISKQLATIKTDCDIKLNIDECKLLFPFSEKTYNFFNDMDFTSLVKNSELFNKQGYQPAKIKREKLTLENLNIFANYNEGYFCYNLLDMEFLCKDKLLYFDKNIDMFSDNLDFSDVIFSLKNIFENENILKLTNSAKTDLHILKKYNIKLKNYYDLSVGNYIVNAGLKISNDIKVEKYFNHYNNLKKQIIENGLSFIYDNIEKPLIEILFSMEENGFRINEDRLNELDNEFKEKLDKLTKNIYEEAGEEFNINSPRQVANILFEKLGIKSYNNKKMSTKADILENLKYIPIVDDILNYRKYAKLKNTYIDVYKKLIKEYGDVIHTTFNQTLTSTGRLSSSEPNLQNIPTRDDYGKNLRKIFVSKFKGGKIISADYNQIELRLLADMSDETDLIQAYKDGLDIHAMTASQIFNIDIDIDKVTPLQRREAKAVNFGIIYGISDYGLSQNIKITRENAKKYIDSYFTRYPNVKKFMDNNIEIAKEKGFAVTKFGRIRRIPEILSSKFQTRSFGERVAMNMPLQGTASDIIKLAMIKVYNALKESNLKSQLILQIHDELIIDTYPWEEEKVKKLLKNAMENVIELKVPLIVSMGEGESLYDCK